MQKVKIDRFINKYSLNGLVNTVRWQITNNQLTTSFVTEDKSLMGSVSVDSVDIEDGLMGVYTTDQLQRLLGVLSDDIDISLVKIDDKCVKIKVSSSAATIEYPLSDLSVIGSPPSLKTQPVFDTKIDVDRVFIDTFIRGKSALSEVNKFTLVKNGELKLIIGYSSTNTNRVTIPVKVTENNLQSNMSFNGDMFKEILLANKECSSATFEISNDGIARINFKVDDYDSTYYVVAMQEDAE
tara:strand:- start:407 stop:1126 length:720 start_codon:yes stop_codon:yes gene_type:complete